MGVKATTNVENKPKATVKNLQFIEKLDRLIDIVEKAEENGDATKVKHRSSYDLVNVRSLYIERYDWFDTVFEEGGKLGLKDIKGDVVVPAKYDGFQERCHFLFARTVPRVALVRGKAGLVKADGSGELVEYVNKVLKPVNAYKGNKLPVSAFVDHIDGTCPNGSAAFEKRGIAVDVPEWQSENCIQCNRCAIVCPHAVIRPVPMTDAEVAAAPEGTAAIPMIGLKELKFTMTVNNNWVKDLADSIQSDLNEVGITMENDESNIDWSALAPSDDDAILPFDVVLTPGDPTCFGADPDLLMSWWYGDNVWTRGRSCWAKAGDGKFEELQQLLQKARETSGDERQNVWNACFDLIAEEVPLYALFHREVATGFDESQIGDFEAIGTTGLMLLGVSPRESS